jgi:hypothetical protein
MKKLFVVVFLFASTLLFAYSYPSKLIDLLTQYKNDKVELSIKTTNNEVFTGEIELVQSDYIIFKGKDGAIVLTIKNIVEIYEN